MINYLYPENKKKKGIYNVYERLDYAETYTKAVIVHSLMPLK